MTVRTPELRAIERVTQGATYAHLPTTETMVARLTALLDGATDAQWSAGFEWYPAFAGIADLLAARHGVTFEEAAATLAILSPRTSVATSVLTTDAVLAAWTTQGEAAARRVSGVLPTNVARAVDWLTGDTKATDLDTGSTLSRSRKVRSFYLNTLGNEDAVTVDVWATKAVGGTMEQPSGGAYVAIAEAYRTVAARFGVTPREAQAIAWVATRTDIDATEELFVLAQWLRTAPAPVAVPEPEFVTAI